MYIIIIAPKYNNLNDKNMEIIIPHYIKKTLKRLNKLEQMGTDPFCFNSDKRGLFPFVFEVRSVKNREKPTKP